MMLGCLNSSSLSVTPMGPFYLVGLFIFSRETVGNNSKVKIEKD